MSMQKTPASILISFCLVNRHQRTAFVCRNTALHFAAWQERDKSIEILQVLIKNGANPKAENIDGDTPLHNASHHGKSFAVLLLLDSGADCLAANRNGETRTFPEHTRECSQLKCVAL